MDRGAVVRVLGAIHVTRGGATVELPSASQRRLLAVLAVHAPQPVRMERLCDLLEVGAGALRTTVGRVRRLVGDDVVVTSATGYRLGVPLDAELAAAALAEAGDDPGAIALALGWWAGRSLEEFAGEAWAVGEAHRLDELHAHGVEDLVDALVAAGRPDEAIAAVRPHLAEHPYRDRPRALLLRAHAAAGRRTEALREYQAYRSFLLDTVGTEPSAELRDVERRIAAGWDGDGHRGHPAEAPVVPAPRADDVVLPPTLAAATTPVGRERELATMAHAFASPGARAVIVSGEAGIGKTTLIAAFAQQHALPGGRRVHYERCDEFVREPYQPLRGLLAQLIHVVPTTVLAEHEAVWGGEVFRLLPHSRAGGSTTTRDVVGDQSTARFVLFEAVADLVRRAADVAPMVLVLDDLHWADQTALHLLRHLVRTLVGNPVLFVLSYRDSVDESAAELRAAAADVVRSGAIRLDLSGLGVDGLGALVRQRTVVPEGSDVGSVARALASETAGNPLFAEHLLDHWAANASLAIDGAVVTFAPGVGAEVPSTLRDLVWLRVRALGSAAEPVLAAAAVLGVEFEERVLVATTGLPASDVADVLDRSAAAGVLADGTAASGLSRFSHALVARALETGLGARRRAQLHDRAFAALSADRVAAVGAGVERRSSRLARHAAEAGRRADALHWATAAGDEAFAALAPDDAVQWYRRALEHVGPDDAARADLLVRLGEALYHAGDPAAFDTLEQGATLARRCGADEVVVRAALALDRGAIVRFGAFAVRQLDIVEAAVVGVAGADDATRARVLAMLAQALVFTDQVDRRAEVAATALALARGCHDPTLLARVAPDLLSALWTPGNAALRSAVAEEALDAVAAMGATDPDLAGAVYKAAHTAAVCAADATQARRCLAGLRSLAEHIREPHLRWTVTSLDGFVAMMEARFDDAQRCIDAAFELGGQIGEPDAWSVFAGQSFALGTFAGRHAELFPLVQHVIDTQESVELPFRIAHALLSVEVGRLEASRALLRDAMDRGMAAIPGDLIRSTSLLGYAILALELDDAEAVAALLPEIEPMVDEVSFNGVTSQGPVAAYVGKLESFLGRHDAAEQHLLAAMAIAESFGWRYHVATTALALAQNRCRAAGGLDADAERWLTTAEELCETHGIASWRTRAAAFRDAAGGAPRQPLG
jgi:DNA-binding SARP family transcriptional activator